MFFKKGFEVNEDTLSRDIIYEIGPFGSFLAHDSTMKKMKSMSQTDLFDRTSREDWQNGGKLKSYDKARSRAMEILENHRPDSISISALEDIRSIVIEAEKEIRLRIRSCDDVC
jgi:trimethylamine--corrinoid protein Co-methyltransferase